MPAYVSQRPYFILEIDHSELVLIYTFQIFIRQKLSSHKTEQSSPIRRIVLSPLLDPSYYVL